MDLRDIRGCSLPESPPERVTRGLLFTISIALSPFLIRWKFVSALETAAFACTASLNRFLLSWTVGGRASSSMYSTVSVSLGEDGFERLPWRAPDIVVELNGASDVEMIDMRESWS